MHTSQRSVVDEQDASHLRSPADIGLGRDPEGAMPGRGGHGHAAEMRARVPPGSALPHRRVVAGLPWVTRLARRMASSLSPAVDLGDLVQDGVLGLIDAARRFDEARGIPFETFAAPRVRGAMIDALRREAWPRGVRRQRRALAVAREALRHELGQEPSLAELATRVGVDEARLRHTLVRLHTIEATAPLAAGVDAHALPTMLVPSQPDSPHAAYEQHETRQRIRRALASLPVREQTVIRRYYYGDVTMKHIGVEIGVNESRVSQLHARALQHLRVALGGVSVPRTVRSGARLAGAAVVAHARPARSAVGASVRAGHAPGGRLTPRGAGGAVSAWPRAPDAGAGRDQASASLLGDGGEGSDVQDEALA